MSLKWIPRAWLTVDAAIILIHNLGPVEIIFPENELLQFCLSLLTIFLIGFENIPRFDSQNTRSLKLLYFGTKGHFQSSHCVFFDHELIASKIPSKIHFFGVGPHKISPNSVRNKLDLKKLALFVYNRKNLEYCKGFKNRRNWFTRKLATYALTKCRYK